MTSDTAGDDAIGQDQVAARQHDHRAALAGAPVDVHVDLVPFERQRGHIGRGAEGVAIETLEQRRQPVLVGRGEHQHAGALGRRELAVVEIVAIERHQRAAELTGEPEVQGVGRAAQLVVLHDEQHVPLEQRAHQRHETRGHVGVHVDARLAGDAGRVRAQFRGERPHLDGGSKTRLRSLFNRFPRDLLRFLAQRRHERVALVHQLLARPPAVGRADGVFAE